MRVTIHQPNFLPYLGFFEKAMYSDVLVIQDTAQFSKENYHNRNSIALNKRAHLISIPVPKDSWRKSLCDVSYLNSHDVETAWKTIQTAYAKAPYFVKQKDALMSLFLRKNTSLCDLNIGIIEFILRCWGYQGRIIRASSLPLDRSLRKSESLLQIVTLVGGTEQVSGSSGLHYLDESIFHKEGIRVVYQKQSETPYREGYIPYVAAIDFLFYNETPPVFTQKVVTNLNVSNTSANSEPHS